MRMGEEGEFDKIYYKRFNPGAVGGADYRVNLGGGFGIVEKEGETIGFVPPGKSVEELIERKKKGGERVDFR